MLPSKDRAQHADLWMDLVLVAFLIGFDVTARLLPHEPGVMPVAASALFAGRVLRVRALALVVPVAAMALSGMVMVPDDWRVTIVVYVAIALPALVGMVTRRWRLLPVTGAMISCSLVFFAASNFAVWAFGGLYPLTWQGLTECYAASLPFLDHTVLGDLFWYAALFGGAWLVQHGPLVSRRSL